MSSMSPQLTSLAEQRMQAHRDLRRYFAEGNYGQAVKEIKQVIANYGSHIGLLLDLASAAYLGNKHSLCRVATQEAFIVFKEVQGLLSDRSYQRSCLALGKMLEEMARVSDALDLYELALRNRAFDRLVNFEFYQKIQVQRLRLMTFCGKSENVHELYNDCFNFETSDLNFKVQLIHGLMLSEIYLHGLEYGRSRLQQLEKSEISNEDRNLVHFDLFEEFLRQGREKDFDFGEMQVSTLSFYEKTLLLLSKAEALNISMSQINSWKDKCSPMCYLKILILAYMKTRQPELRHRLIFEINGLNTQSQKILKKVWKEVIEEKQEFVFKVSVKMIAHKHIAMAVRENSFDSQIVGIFSQTRQMSVENLIHKIYNIEQGDVYAFEKLRIAILRFNQKIERKFHLEQVIKISQGLAVLKEGIRFERE